MHKLKKVALGGFLSIIALWLVGRLVLTVQLPDRQGRRNAFPDPMESGPSLRAVFDRLPDGNIEKSPLRLIDDNTLAWLERWRLLQGARERLDICYFILKPDVFGISFLGLLVQKAKEGLRIRVLLDAMGTKMSRSFKGNDYLDTLVSTGNVSLRMYRPLFYRYADAFLTLNPAAVFVSNHDKVLLADGDRALIGGRNISKEYFAQPTDDPLAFRDTDLILSGPFIGKALREAFDAEYASGEAKKVEREDIDLKDSTDDLLLAYVAMDAWLHDRPIPAPEALSIREKGLPWMDQLEQMPHLRGALKKEPPPVTAEVRLIDSRCRLVESDDPVTRSLIRLVRSAREEIFIQSPYLVLPKEAVDVLAEAAGRGVRITIVTNSPLSSDNAMSQGVFLEQWPELLARIPGLRLFVADDRHNLHSKLAVFDRRLALVGTYNLDPLSMAMNSELVAAIWSESFSEMVLEPREKAVAEEQRLVEYRIGRTSRGDPRRDEKAKVVVEFGAEDHIDAARFGKIRFYQRLYALISRMKGDYPWY